MADDLEAFERILDVRWSCRAFLPDPVPRDRLERILTAAQKTASWNNVQPWQVSILSGAAKDRFRDAMVQASTEGRTPAPDIPFPEAYEGVFKERRRTCGFQLYDAVGIERGDKQAYARQTLRNFQLFDAPHVAIITTEAKLGTYAVLDCGAFVTNFMNAAAADGVATIAQAALSVHADVVRAILQLPPERLVVCGVSFGFADADADVNTYRTERAGLEKVVTWKDQ